MSDEAKIKETVLNYIEGWYEGNSGRMEKALDSRLVKRRVVSADEIWDIAKPGMIELTKKGQGKIENPEQGRKDIKILDISGNLASVKVISNKFVDYIHLAKIDAGWKIINVAWDFV
ncbi:MAG: nuclear transport factor 2 family protein [Spirochaetales bacterium]|nr:nuclear transport factor 2 family protein [Spirochaetales bacterium]